MESCHKSFWGKTFYRCIAKWGGVEAHLDTNGKDAAPCFILSMSRARVGYVGGPVEGGQGSARRRRLLEKGSAVRQTLYHKTPVSHWVQPYHYLGRDAGMPYQTSNPCRQKQYFSPLSLQGLHHGQAAGEVLLMVLANIKT